MENQNWQYPTLPDSDYRYVPNKDYRFMNDEITYETINPPNRRKKPNKLQLDCDKAFRKWFLKTYSERVRRYKRHRNQWYGSWNTHDLNKLYESFASGYLAGITHAHKNITT